jgi:hypothetical protein
MKPVIVFPLALLLAAASASSSAQVAKRLDLTASQESACGPIILRAQMIDAADMGMPAQRVRIQIKNLASKPIVSERFTIHFRQNSPDSQESFGTETRLEIGAQQETAFAETSTDTEPISYVTFDTVTYADGSVWHPAADATCKVVPGTLRN